MLWFVIIGFLSAFGALCAFHILMTLCRKPEPGIFLICTGISIHRELAAIRRHKRLSDLGLLKCPLILIDSKFPQTEQQLLSIKHPYLLFYTKAEFIAIFEENDHAGTGNSTRHHCRSNLPKL